MLHIGPLNCNLQKRARDRNRAVIMLPSTVSLLTFELSPVSSSGSGSRSLPSAMFRHAHLSYLQHMQIRWSPSGYQTLLCGSALDGGASAGKEKEKKKGRNLEIATAGVNYTL